jgi:hypothetical protein
VAVMDVEAFETEPISTSPSNDGLFIFSFLLIILLAIFLLLLYHIFTYFFDRISTVLLELECNIITIDFVAQ